MDVDVAVDEAVHAVWAVDEVVNPVDLLANVNSNHPPVAL